MSLQLLNSEILTFGGIFKDDLGIFLGAFSTKIGVYTLFQAELHRIMIVVEYANKKFLIFFGLKLIQC